MEKLPKYSHNYFIKTKKYKKHNKICEEYDVWDSQLEYISMGLETRHIHKMLVERFLNLSCKTVILDLVSGLTLVMTWTKRTTRTQSDTSHNSLSKKLLKQVCVNRTDP